MRVGRIGGVPVKLNPLALPMIALALLLGSGQELAVLGASVLLHELGHVAAARLLRVRVLEMELMPVGGAARLDNVWKLRPGQLVGVALAGPLVNLLIALCCAALPPGPWRMTASRAARMNITLCLFNLMPALPLDGGRVLCGLLARRMSPGAAVRVGVRLGIAAACGLIALAAWGLARGQLNLTPVAAALFMLLTAPTELRNAGAASIASLMERREELVREQIMPVRVLAVSPETDLRSAMTALKPRQVHLFLRVDEDGQTFLSEEAMWRALIAGDVRTVGEIEKAAEWGKTTLSL